MAKKNYGLKVADIVELYLREESLLRDDYMSLMAAMWQDQCEELNIKTLDHFFMAMSTGNILNASTVIRASRQLQKENPELRPTPEIQELNRLRQEQIRQRLGNIEE